LLLTFKDLKPGDLLWWDAKVTHDPPQYTGLVEFLEAEIGHYSDYAKVQLLNCGMYHGEIMSAPFKYLSKL